MIFQFVFVDENIVSSWKFLLLKKKWKYVKNRENYHLNCCLYNRRQSNEWKIESTEKNSGSQKGIFFHSKPLSTVFFCCLLWSRYNRRKGWMFNGRKMSVWFDREREWESLFKSIGVLFIVIISLRICNWAKYFWLGAIYHYPTISFLSRKKKNTGKQKKNPNCVCVCLCVSGNHDGVAHPFHSVHNQTLYPSVSSLISLCFYYFQPNWKTISLFSNSLKRSFDFQNFFSFNYILFISFCTTFLESTKNNPESWIPENKFLDSNINSNKTSIALYDSLTIMWLTSTRMTCSFYYPLQINN